MLQKREEKTADSYIKNLRICGYLIKNSETSPERQKGFYPTKLIIFPGTIIIFFGVFPANCAMVLSSAKTIS